VRLSINPFGPAWPGHAVLNGKEFLGLPEAPSRRGVIVTTTTPARLTSCCPLT
jgi:hypothetical protein